jgi:DNA polymerase-3 subunit beta
MRLFISRDILLKPLRAVASIIERKAALMAPILGHVLLEVTPNKLCVTTSDQDIELTAWSTCASLVGTGAFTVPCRKLLDICRVLEERAILEFIREADKIIVVSGRNRFVLTALAAQDFPKIRIPPAQKYQCRLSGAHLRSLIERTSFAMADQDVRYYLNGLSLEFNHGVLHAAAADGHRLALGTVQCEEITGPGVKILLPRKGITELLRILSEDAPAEVEIFIGDQYVCVHTERLTLISKLLGERVPCYTALVSEKLTRVILGARESIKDALHRASALLIDKSAGVLLQWSENLLKIIATNSEQDEVEVEVAVEYSGDPFELGLNVKYLLDILQVLPTDRVKFSFPETIEQMCIEGEGDPNQIYLIMPMQL